MAERNPDPETKEISLFDPAMASAPQPIYRTLLRDCPVARQKMFGSPVLSRYEDVIAALKDPGTYSSAMDLQIQLGTQRPMIPQQIDPPAQTKFRKILDPRFSKKRMQEIEPPVRAHAHALIDAFEKHGHCEFNREFAVPLPCTAFLRLMGLPQSDLALFLRLKDGIIRPHTLMEAPTLEGQQALRIATGKEIYAYFDAAIAERRERPGDDMLSYLLAAEVDGERLTHEEILDVSFLLILAGLDTVTATLGCNLAFLAQHPAHRDQLVRDPSLIPAAVEELLRWQTPVTIVPRVLKQDVKLHGAELKKGELVTLLLGASDVDASQFPDPERVDFARTPNRHIAFGAGPHRCLGSHLARMELAVAMEVWHQRIPRYAIRAGETPRYSPAIREVQYLPLAWGEGA